MTILSRSLRIILVAAAVGMPLRAVSQTPAEAVAAGLAEQLATAARALEEGRRHGATQALDRALHLAEFAEASASGTEAFRAALHVVKSARHELQMGRPEDAAQILAQGAAALEPLSDEISMKAVAATDLSEVEGLPILNVMGERLGEITGFTEVEGALFAAVEHGNFIFFGGSTAPIPAERLYTGAGFVLLPEDVAPSEIGRDR